MYQQWTTTADIFLKVSTTDSMGSFPKQMFHDSYIETNSNYMHMDFLEFLILVFNPYSFIFQSSIWRMISV